MFQKMINNLKLFWRSSSAAPILISFILGIASSIGAIFSTLAIFPIISGLSLILLLIFLITSQIRVANLKIKKGLQPDHLQLITQNMKEAVIIYTPDFKIIDFNPAAEELFGIKREEIVDQTISPSFVKNEKFKPLIQVIFPSLAPKVVQVSESGWPQITEVSTENGLRLNSIFMRTTDKNQRSTSFVKIIQDKTKEQELAEVKSEFISASARQIQTPLEKLDKIFQEAKTEEGMNQEKIAQGIRLSREILRTIKNLLEVTKLEEGRYLYDFQKIDLVALLNEITEKAGVLAEDYKISISSSFPDSLPVIADPPKITAVLSTLIDNALKYTNEGGSVNISAEREDNTAKVAVSDTGIGIEESELDKIFQKFYHTKRGMELVPSGGGLGLYIAKRIIEKHKGNIWAESIPNRGSTFYFTLPLVK